ncbi:VENN motif pre-toxin domain-containing protein [Ignatzschineria indica]|uniref:VENN motif pre-toxin domain-containing protein n=1 Tax=Ignatzschineria indica TaxID=472583 RepID=UPI0025772CD9|nr:VENN motif pre-toxin domain-containing protein [Ignatzschineria indica]MDM1545850.1 VENN motif pre-toxin domain-containing protein [Ignatzschineria indica]
MEFVYGKGKTPEDLTAEEKNTLSAIIGILGTGAGALTGDSAIDAVIGESVATNAVENNYVLNKIDNCKNLSSKECGRAGDLVNQIFEYNPELPSLDDLNSLLSNCETESCAVKVLQEHHKEISDATLATIKEMGIQGELSREDIAFIESMVGSEILLQLQGHSGETGGGKLWQHELLNSWTNGQELYSFLDNEYRIKELVDEGYSPEEAAAKVGKEEFLTTLASMLVGGGKGGNTKSGSSSKGKEEVGKETNDVSASTPTGSKGNVLNIPDGINKPTTINDRQFSGHALDRMQRQGITPSTVESAINSQNAVVGKIPGTTAYHDKVNNITVITDTKSGRVGSVEHS